MSAMLLAVSLLLQFTTPISKTAAEVALLGNDEAVPLAARPAAPSSHNVRLVFLVFSTDSLALPGERASLRVKDSAPHFQITLPAGVDPDDVRLVRLKPKDGRRAIAHTSSLDHPFNKRDLMPIAIEAVKGAPPRTYRLAVSAPLAAGEYALLIDLRFFDFAVS